MYANYEAFIDRLIHDYEGGYGWNSKDTGGPTKYGITCYDLAEYRHETMTSMAKWAPIVRAMTLDEAEQIYRLKYALPLHFDDLPSGVDVVGLDYGVNSGVARPVLVWRRLLNKPGDNKMDLGLVNAAAKVDPWWLIDETCAERLRFMRSIRKGDAWVTFGKGWQKRVDDLRAYSKQLATGPAIVRVTKPVVGPQAKAVHAAGSAGGATTGALVAAGAAGYAAGLPWWGIAAACAAVVTAGVAYELIHERAAAAANKVVHI
jgi:lysozyme family protein